MFPDNTKGGIVWRIACYRVLTYIPSRKVRASYYQITSLAREINCLVNRTHQEASEGNGRVTSEVVLISAEGIPPTALIMIPKEESPCNTRMLTLDILKHTQ